MPRHRGRSDLACAVRRHARAACLALVLAGCAARTPVRLQATSLAVGAIVVGEFEGVVTLDEGLVTLALERTHVQFVGLSAGDSTPLGAVTVRAVVVADSAGQAIPLGVSHPVEVAGELAAGEARDLGALTLALPLPPDRRPVDLWLAFQFTGTARSRGGEPQVVVAYLCSVTNLFGATRSATARERRMRASYAAGCRL